MSGCVSLRKSSRTLPQTSLPVSNHWFASRERLMPHHQLHHHHRHRRRRRRRHSHSHGLANVELTTC